DRRVPERGRLSRRPVHRRQPAHGPLAEREPGPITTDPRGPGPRRAALDRAGRALAAGAAAARQRRSSRRLRRRARPRPDRGAARRSGPPGGPPHGRSERARAGRPRRAPGSPDPRPGPGRDAGGLGVSVPAARPGLPWAVIVMEGAVVYPALSTWLAGPERRVPLGPAAAVAMLALGYLAAQHSPLFGHRVQRLEYGAAASLLARLLVSAWSGAPSPLVWLGTAVLPAAVGLALWWRGVALGEAEFSIGGVRNEFTIAGGALLVLLTVFRDVAGIDPYTSAIAVVLFLSSGLMAVGTARQEAAGLPASPGASALVALAALVLLVASLAL